MCKAIIGAAQPELIKCLCECVMNVIKGNVPMKAAHKSRLTRHKKDLRFLAKKGNSLERKKKVLQKGGILPALLSPVIAGILPALAPAIGSGIGVIISASKRR